ncbi:uncharacterized protein LOC129759339 [Uranotaenia lowii]|uniref:uncharacterized protein LOC129759339 n=1 Tax=Uranotaenia lowii TaxID=190385 RepID=UPI0024793BEE|nr:uncharacterized protein LOC129759339 [Uranotaenia lowii]
MISSSMVVQTFAEVSMIRSSNRYSVLFRPSRWISSGRGRIITWSIRAGTKMTVNGPLPNEVPLILIPAAAVRKFRLHPPPDPVAGCSKLLGPARALRQVPPGCRLWSYQL